jgi:glutaredoxin 3
MARVKVYSTGICPICDNAKKLLNKWNIPYVEARVDRDHSMLKEMSVVTNGARMVPQFVIDGKWIGGFTELTMLHMDGELNGLIATTDMPGAN